MNTQERTSTMFPKASELSKKPKLKVPNLSSELFKDQKMFYQFDTSVTPPPLSTTSCFINETTNTDPNLMRSTMYTLPNTSNFFESLNIPFGVSVTPFSYKSDSKLVLQHEIRCNQCLSYININWRIKEEDVVCNICKYPNNIAKLSVTPEVLKDMLKYTTYEISTPIQPESTSNKNFVDSEYFSAKLFDYPAFIFVLDSSFNYNDEFIEKITEVIENDTFRLLYKYAVFMTRNSIFGDDNSNVIEYKLEYTPFIPPNVFFMSSSVNKNVLSTIFKTIEKTNRIDNKAIQSIDGALRKVSKYSLASKVIIFSDVNFNLLEIEKTSINYFASSYKYKKELVKICCSEAFFNVSVDVKTSNGIAKNAVYTETEVENFIDVRIPSMDNCSTVTYTFYIDDYITDSKAYIQFIIKYSTYDGKHKTMILNQSYKITKQPHEIYNNIAFDSLFSCFCKYICKDISNIKRVEEMICKFLKYYRKTCCKDIAPTQFVLPETTKLLPVLYQSVVKNNIFSISTVKAQSKKEDLKKLLSFSVEQNLRYFYPRLFTLTDYYIDQDLSKIQYLKLSMTIIDPCEIYVLENSQKIYLYIGKDVDPSLKEGLFKNPDEYAILMKLVDDINGNYGYELPIVVIEEGKTACEVEFYGCMVEDALNGVCSYFDYVCELHFKVQKA